jgi:ketosteroid isomerase-like protein
MEITPETLVELRRVEQLKYDYCWAYDRGDLDRLVGLFTDDAVCELGFFGTWRGTEEIRAGYGELMAATGIPGSRRHAVTNPEIEIDGDRATGRWCVLDFRTEEGLAQPVRIVAVVEDDYRRVDGAWRIARSRLDVQWVEPS